MSKLSISKMILLRMIETKSPISLSEIYLIVKTMKTTDPAFSSYFSTNRGTIRQSLSVLRSLGYVESIDYHMMCITDSGRRFLNSILSNMNPERILNVVFNPTTIDNEEIPFLDELNTRSEGENNLSQIPVLEEKTPQTISERSQEEIMKDALNSVWGWRNDTVKRESCINKAMQLDSKRISKETLHKIFGVLFGSVNSIRATERQKFNESIGKTLRILNKN